MVRLKSLVVLLAAVAAIAIGATALGGPGDSASGAGYWMAQNASVGFEARQTVLADGQFDFRRANGNARGVGFHGDVNCIHVEGTRAWLRIVVTQSTDSSHPVGATRIAYVEDNGNGQSGVRDEFNLRNPDNDPANNALCDRNANDSGSIFRGNAHLEDGP